MDATTVGFISAITALVASILGPTVTLVVAKRQFNANVVSANRQKWIDALRQELAELIALIGSAMVIKQRWRADWRGGQGPLEADPTLMPKVEQIVLAYAQIQLLTNTSQADHRQLIEAVESALEHLKADGMMEAEIEVDVENITRCSRAIIQREWRRVKQGI